MIPCCFHPTRVLLVDDRPEFLEGLSRLVSTNHASYQYMTLPQKALHYLNEVYKPDPFPNRYVQPMEEGAWEHNCLDINIFDMHNEMYRAERFEEISVVVVDHAMPGMSGVELCQRIKDPNIQKILLTGVADEHIAIRAFNEGIIHHYIRKQDSNMTDQLKEAIEKAQWRYFNNLSEIILKSITVNGYEPQAIADPKFQKFFRNLITSNTPGQPSFKEAYLCEGMGSYLLLTETGEGHGLIVNTEAQMGVWTDSAESDKADPGLIEELNNRTKMMWYHKRNGPIEPPGAEWVKHAYVPKIFQGIHRDYYYIFAPNLFDIGHSDVLPFETYLTNQQFEIR